jgi:hypothetical protein
MTDLDCDILVVDDDRALREGLSRDANLADIPLVIMSGIVAEECAPLRKGDLGFFRKPINFDGVLARVLSVARGRGAHRSPC